jgi:hypothetical protein
MRLGIFVLIILFFSCSNPTIKNPLETALSSQNEKIKKVMNDLEKYEVQILYTEITRNIDNSINFIDYSFQVDDSTYFYPASTVKLPIAVLALEKMNEQSVLSRNSRFYVEGDSVESTFAREIEKIFAVSDNEASNRLFEYLGKDAINERLLNKGIESRISHRLSTENSAELTTKPLVFYLNDSTSTTTPEINNSQIEYLRFERLSKGVGYIEADSLINEPKDFSLKNYLPLTSLHNLMKQLIFPELYPQHKQFRLSNDDRNFLLSTMKILPKDAGYISEDYYDSFGKFLIYGDTKEPIPSYIEIYNKVGYAYGYLTDCAYIVNKQTNSTYIITATIHVNENGIFNDNNYEYETVGIPFLAELGRQLILE